MRKYLLAAGLAAALSMAAAQANATAFFTFFPGVASPTTGFALIDTFDTTAGLTGTNFQIKTPPSDGNGAPPANSFPAGTPYLSVLGGGSATIDLGKVQAVEFDWGSIDAYNTLTVGFDGVFVDIVPGASGNFITTPADGNQLLPATNGLFLLYSDDGSDYFTSLTFKSSQNSFEVDNLAVVGVPEPATWGMMLVGIGGLGAMMRRRRALALA